MPRHLLPLLLLGALACTGRTAPLPIQDLVVDDDDPTDGGALVDSGFMPLPTPDAGLFDPDAGLAVCGFAGPLAIGLRIDAPPELPAYQGTALVTNGRPLRLFLDQIGLEVEVGFEGVALPDRLSPGAAVFVEYGVDDAPWTNAAILFREFSPRGGAGEAFFALWRFGEFEDDEIELEIDDILLRYVVDDCARTNFDECGPARTETLIVDGPGARLEVPAGTFIGDAPLGVRFGNGRSYRYAPGPECPDTPAYWREGFMQIGG